MITSGSPSISWIKVYSIQCLLVASALGACYYGGQEADVASEGVWDVSPEQRWTVSEDLRIGEVTGYGPSAFGDIRCLGIDPMERIWIVDAFSAEIRVFQSDGEFVRAVGGRGDGPSEFQRIGDMFPGPGDQIWVEDLSLRRYEIFDTAGNRIGGHRVVISNMSNAPRAWSEEGVFVVGDLRMARFYEESEGELVPLEQSALWPQRQPDAVPAVQFESTGEIRGSTAARVPFASTGRGFLGSELDYWDARYIGTNGYIVRRFRLEDGQELLAIKHRYDPVPIPDSIRMAAAELVISQYTAGGGKLVSNFDWKTVPEYYPAFDAFFASSVGTVWVRRVRTAGGGVGFDVFAADGQYLGQPTTPRSLTDMDIQVITANSIYAIDTDDLGVEHVVKLGISGGDDHNLSHGFLTGCR